jgi:DNA repair protein RadC
LSESELLAIILRSGTRGENVIEMSNRIIAKHGLSKLSELSMKELQEIKGIGPAKAAQILAMFELNKRKKASKSSKRAMKSAKDVFEYATNKWPRGDREQFMIMHLNTKGRVIGDEVVSVGTLNSSLIHPREVFKSAVKESSNSVILAHNHPSGDPEPSVEDEEVTKRLSDAGKVLGITLLDHVIVAGDKYYSFAQNQRL